MKMDWVGVWNMKHGLSRGLKYEDTWEYFNWMWLGRGPDDSINQSINQSIWMVEGWNKNAIECCHSWMHKGKESDAWLKNWEILKNCHYLEKYEQRIKRVWKQRRPWGCVLNGQRLPLGHYDIPRLCRNNGRNSLKNEIATFETDLQARILTVRLFSLTIFDIFHNCAHKQTREAHLWFYLFLIQYSIDTHESADWSNYRFTTQIQY